MGASLLGMFVLRLEAEADVSPAGLLHTAQIWFVVVIGGVGTSRSVEGGLRQRSPSTPLHEEEAAALYLERHVFWKLAPVPSSSWSS